MVTTSGRTLSLSLHGDLDLATRDRLAEVTARFAERCITGQRNNRAAPDSSIPDAVVDAGDVRFIDDAALCVLVTLHTRLAEAGIRLRTQRPTAMLRRISGICDLDALLGLDPSPAHADDGPGVAAADPAAPGRGRPPVSVSEREHLVLVQRAGARS